MNDNYDYDRILQMNDKLMECGIREYKLETKLKSMEMHAHFLNMELYESRLEQLELLKIIDGKINK